MKRFFASKWYGSVVSVTPMSGVILGLHHAPFWIATLGPITVLSLLQFAVTRKL